MRDLDGKTAFITGGASGIGLAVAAACGREGMNVFIADIDQQALSAAVASLQSSGIATGGCVLDVTQRGRVATAVAECVARFGKVHLLVNSAGVMVSAAFGAMPPAEWRWLIDVNMKGVVNGVEAAVPLMRAHGEGGHIVNIASIVGFQTAPGFEAYAATKAAVIGMSEAWRIQIGGTGVGVSVVCPGPVRTNLLKSRLHRGAAYGGPQDVVLDDAAMAKLDAAMAPELVAARIIEGVMADEQHIFTHVEYRTTVEHRLDELVAAFDRVDASTVMREEADA